MATRLFCLTAVCFMLVPFFARADEKPAPRVDQYGDPLPEGVIARMGTSRFRHNGFIRRLAFSPDWKLVAAGGEKTVRVWEAATGKLVHKFDTGDHWSLGLGFSPDSKSLTVASGRKKFLCTRYDLTTGRPINVRDWTDTDDVWEVTVSPDGRLVAVEKSDKTLRIYDAFAGTEQRRVGKEYVRDLAFSHDGKLLAVCDITDTVQLFDTATLDVIRELKHANDKVCRVSISPDGRYLASIPWSDNPGAEAAEASIWDVKTGKEMHRISGLRTSDSVAVFSPDGSALATGGNDHDLILWETATGNPLRHLATPCLASVAAFSPDGKTVAGGNSVGTVTFWNTEDGKTLPTSATPGFYVRELRYAQGGKRLVGIADIAIAWDPLTGKELERFPRVESQFAYLARVSPDESMMAIGGKPGEIRILDARTGKESKVLRGQMEWVRAIHFSQDSRRLYSGSRDKSVRVWDLANGTELHKLSGHNHTISILAESPDGRWLASACTDGGARGAYEIRLWDLNTGSEVRQFRPKRGSAFAITFSPDGRYLAAVGGEPGRSNDRGEVQVWEVATGKEQGVFIGHKERVTCVAFSPDSRMLATGGLDNSIRLWEVTSGQMRDQLLGHHGAIQALAFSPDGRSLAAASPEAPVYIWSLHGR